MRPEADPRQQAYQDAVRLLATREHSARELKTKLARRFEQAVVESVLGELREQGLQSDERFTEQYVRSRRDRGYGPLRIRGELLQRGVNEVLIGRWLDEQDPCWRERMLAVARRKYGPDGPLDQREQARRGRFLVSRGFPSHLINEYLFS